MKDLLKFMSLLKEGYLKAVNPVCVKYDLTYAEFDVLLFLANNPECDTATDIVEKRYIAKSQVSISIKALEAKNYLARTYQNNNRRTIHLKICDLAKDAIRDGRKAQKIFYEAVLAGFSKEDRESMRRAITCMADHVEQYIGRM